MLGQLTEEESLIAQWFSQHREEDGQTSNEAPETNWIPVKEITTEHTVAS